MIDTELMDKIRFEAEQAAVDAADGYFREQMQGEDRGMCGFAWVTLFPEHKGNTRQGKDERKLFEALGASKDWTGKAWQIWNPANYPVQNIDTLEAGARACAEVLKQYGFNAVSQSRLD